jgi:hypothetical protein
MNAGNGRTAMHCHAFTASRLLWGCVAFGLPGMYGSAAEPIRLAVTLTVDNTYALYHGTLAGADALVASDTDWTAAEINTLSLPDSGYIYVVAYTDASGAQGFLAQVTNTSTNDRFYSSDPRWQVTCTGITTNAAPSIGDLTNEIRKANAGANPCGGWVSTTVGQRNLNARPWNTIEGIDSAARWVWYDSNLDSRMCAPFDGYDHNEYLIFRALVERTPVAPDTGGRRKKRR